MFMLVMSILITCTLSMLLLSVRKIEKSKLELIDKVVSLSDTIIDNEYYSLQ